METSLDLRPRVDQIWPTDLMYQKGSPVLALISKLGNALAMEDITYCHWKSNDVIDRSYTGENDLDLLVSRSDVSRFTEILFRLGFKQAEAPKEREMPGVLDYFGFDKETGILIHVHAHYQLVLGSDMTKNYRLPIEKPYLESAVQGDLFKVPAPEFEYIVFVMRMILKHSTWDAFLVRQGSLKTKEQKELAYLQARVNKGIVYESLSRHIPYISTELFDDCVRALEPSVALRTRVQTGQRLQAKLNASARRPVLIDVYLKLWRRVKLAVRRRIFMLSPKYRLQNGGALIAIIGGDGAGKSTAVEGIVSWLSQYFTTTAVHMGKPAWSWTTKVTRGILKVGNWLGLIPMDASFQKTVNQKSVVSPGYPWLLREVCRARDRYATFIRAKRFAACGGLVIVDRFPLRQIKLMDGPQTRRFISELAAGSRAAQFLSPRRKSRLAECLVNQEESYYRRITSPELSILLLVDPEIAVRRKTDENPASVRERSTEIWKVDWQNTDSYVIDGSQSKEDVLAELKQLIWSVL